MDFRDRLACLLLAIGAIAVGWLLSAAAPPIPRVHDEFSYLLAADTFASGRLTNPTHPLWRHFETMHVVHQPTYASKYPPGKPLMLALGSWLCGRPIAGVWIASSLGILASYYLLRGFVPRKWATRGAALLLVLPGYQIIWGQTFWGGSVAYAGGALVLGGAWRLARAPRVADSLLAATGAVMLAVSRPFEGAVFCLLVTLFLAVRWLRPPSGERPTELAWRHIVSRGLVPAMVVGMLGLVMLGVYNSQVTGDPLKMPYQVHETTYGVCPLFLWQEARPSPVYLHKAIADFHQEWSMDWLRRQETWEGLLRTKWEMLLLARRVYLPWALGVPLLGLLWWRGSKLRIPLLLLATTWLLTQVSVWNWPHYIAPVGPVLLLAVVYGLRNIDLFARRHGWGIRPATVLVACQVLAFVGTTSRHVTAPREGWHYQRHAIHERLKTLPGNDLVIVRYTPEHSPHREWVYNRASIDEAPVVWARDMGENRELLDYFADRKVWLVEADAVPPRLVPYRPALTAD